MVTTVKVPLYIQVISQDGVDRAEVTKLIDHLIVKAVNKSLSSNLEVEVSPVTTRLITGKIGPFSVAILTQEAFMRSLEQKP